MDVFRCIRHRSKLARARKGLNSVDSPVVEAIERAV